MHSNSTSAFCTGFSFFKMRFIATSLATKLFCLDRTHEKTNVAVSFVMSG